jgi:hypothetical protein
MHRADPHHRLTRVGQVFIVLAQSAITAQPSQRPFHFPTHRQWLEPLLAGWSAGDLQPVRSMVEAQPLVQSMVMVFVIREHDDQSREVAARRLSQHLLSGLSIIHVRRRHHDGDEQPQAVHKDMTLPAVDFLAAIGTEAAITDSATLPPLS